MEEWRDISGYEGNYQVSNLGRVKSLPRSVFMSNYNRYIITTEKILNHNIGNVGYPRVSLYKNQKGRQFCVHSLVADAFIPKSEGGSDVNHIDGNKQNPILTNLERVSRRENTCHGLLNRSVNKKIGVVFLQRPQRRDKWKATIWITGKGHKHLGQFNTQEEATAAYQRALCEYGIENKYAKVA